MIEHDIEEYLKQEWTGGAASLSELRWVTFLLQRAKTEIERLKEYESQCIDIFNDFTDHDITEQPKSIQMAYMLVPKNRGKND